MQAKEAEELRKEWGEKPCSHDHVEREYYLGAHTGDYVCTTCGRDFTSLESVERERKSLCIGEPMTDSSDGPIDA